MGGGGLGGMVGGVLGGDDGGASRSGAESASQAGVIVSKEGLDYAKSFAERMTDVGSLFDTLGQAGLDGWEAMYGGIEQNLSSYYKNLDPVKFATQNKISLAENLDKQFTQLNEDLAAKNLLTGGMAAQNMKEKAYAQAVGDANIDFDSEEQVRGMQANFLNYGKGQQDRALGQVAKGANFDTTGSNSVLQQYGNVVNAQMGLANTYSNNAAQEDSQYQYNVGLGSDMINAGIGGATGAMQAPTGGGGMGFLEGMGAT